MLLNKDCEDYKKMKNDTTIPNEESFYLNQDLTVPDGGDSNPAFNIPIPIPNTTVSPSDLMPLIEQILSELKEIRLTIPIKIKINLDDRGVGHCFQCQKWFVETKAVKKPKFPNSIWWVCVSCNMPIMKFPK